MSPLLVRCPIREKKAFLSCNHNCLHPNGWCGSKFARSLEIYASEMWDAQVDGSLHRA